MRLKDRIFSKSSIVGLILIVAAIVCALMFFKSDKASENTTVEFLEATITYAGRVKEEEHITGDTAKQNIQITYTFKDREYEKMIGEVNIKEPLQVGDILRVTVPSVDSPTDVEIITSTTASQNYTLLIIAAVLFLMGLFMIFIYY